MSRVLSSTATFIDDGGLQTVKMNFRFDAVLVGLGLQAAHDRPLLVPVGVLAAD